MGQLAEFEDKVAMQDDLPEDKVKAEREKMKSQLEEMVKDCLQTVHKVPNLVALAHIMSKRKEFPLVIKVGQRCEERIDELTSQLEKREELTKSQSELMAKVTLQKDGATKKQQKELDEIAESLEALPVIYENKQQLSSWFLEVAGLIIAAAKIEDNDEVLRSKNISQNPMFFFSNLPSLFLKRANNDGIQGRHHC